MAACWQIHSSHHITSLHIRAHTHTRRSPRICGHPRLASDKCYLSHREHLKKWFTAEMTERRERRAKAWGVRKLQEASWMKWVCRHWQKVASAQKVSYWRSELLKRAGRWPTELQSTTSPCGSGYPSQLHSFPLCLIYWLAFWHSLHQDLHQHQHRKHIKSPRVCSSFVGCTHLSIMFKPPVYRWHYLFSCTW